MIIINSFSDAGRWAGRAIQGKKVVRFLGHDERKDGKDTGKKNGMCNGLILSVITYAS